MSIYYIIYDASRIHWFSKKETTDQRNLQAIKNKLEKFPNLVHEEISLSENIEKEIKSSVLRSLPRTIKLIREENSFILPIMFPEDIY